MKLAKRWVIGFWICTILTSCSTTTQQLKQDVIYKADTSLTINGVQYYGTAAPLVAPQYEIIVRAKKNMDYFVFRTCHREIILEGVGDVAKLVFKPVVPEEMGCPAEIEGLNAKGRHSFGFIVFPEPVAQLPMVLGESLEAALKCNGSEATVKGLSVCQAGVGLIQSVSFKKPVYFAEAGNPLGCELGLPKKGNYFQFKMPRSTCRYTFAEVDGPHLKHTLYTRGYEDFVLQEN